MFTFHGQRALPVRAMKPKHKWHNIVIESLDVSGDSPEYQKYCADIEKLYKGYIKPAPFGIWRIENLKLMSV